MPSCNSGWFHLDAWHPRGKHESKSEVSIAVFDHEDVLVLSWLLDHKFMVSSDGMITWYYDVSWSPLNI